MILELPQIKSVTVSIVFTSICHEVMGLEAMNFIFWMLSFFFFFLEFIFFSFFFFLFVVDFVIHWNETAKGLHVFPIPIPPVFSLPSFAFIKRLFSSSLLSAMRVVSPAYLRLLIFLLEILIPACALYNPAFCMIYSACRLNKQGDNIHPRHTPFLSWNQPIVSRLFLAVASWTTYRFLSRQVR